MTEATQEETVNKGLGACLHPEPLVLEPPGRKWTEKSHGVIGQACCRHRGGLCLGLGSCV